MVVLPRCSWRQTATKVTICEHQNKTQEIVPTLRKDQDRNHGLANKLSNDTETDNLAIGVGNIRVQTLHDEFNVWSIEIDRKFKLTRENWKSLKRVAEISIDSIVYF